MTSRLKFLVQRNSCNRHRNCSTKWMQSWTQPCRMWELFKMRKAIWRLNWARNRLSYRPR